MNPPRKVAAVLPAAMAGATAAVLSIWAQPLNQPPNPAPPATSQMNLNLVVLDPAHGGPDPGAQLGTNVFEKDVTLAMAARLRSASANANFNIITTRDANSDPATPLSTDQRAEIANRTHAVACIVLHATNSGSGVHVYTSSLSPTDSEQGGNESPSTFVPVPWEMAQATSVRQSLQLADDLRSSLAAGNLPVAVAKAPVRPLDNLMCPAVAIELAPLDATPVTDANYQQRVVAALAAALTAWRTQAASPPQQQVPQ